MTNYLRILLFFAIASCVSGQETVNNSASDQAAAALVKRILPKKADAFVIDTSLSKQNGQDVFSVSDTDAGKILLQGNNGVSVASALNWYLKNITHNHLSWCGDQLHLPDTLPKVGKKVTVISPNKFRVYFNYCTLSYSAPWWNWKRWQREIDFMALNGINAPLAPIGLEAVWYHTLLKHGFSDLEARTYLVDPSHMAWQWMTNIESYGGPLPKSWIDSHIKLGRQILDLQRSLGMTPIQQGFSGCVPVAMIKKFPNAKILREHGWAGFPGTAQLDPLDPFFLKFGKTFLAEQERLFGTSHLYGCDPFHEGSPPVAGNDYLVKVGKNIQKLLNAHDPKSLWVMQAWSIRKPIVTAVPKDRLLILDLAGLKHKQTQGFWGYNFVSGRLHNFGGRIVLHGDLALLAKNPFAQIKKEFPKNSVGMGLFMEGIIHNPVYYDMAFDTIWQTDSIDIKDWISNYVHRRYGAKTANSQKAWEILLETAYGKGTDGHGLSSIIAARPAITPKKSGPNEKLSVPYDNVKLLKAWELLLADADQLKDSDGYRFDLVDIGRQVLSNHGHDLQKRIREAYFKKDIKAFEAAAAKFHQLLKDTDTLIGPRKEYSLGDWVNSARAWGTTPEEKNHFERNARELVTIWGPMKNSYLFDYAWREWHGLIEGYYLKRWEMFHKYIAQLMRDGKDYNEKLPMVWEREAFRSNDIYKKMADWEVNWVKTPSPISSEPVGDEIELAKAMYQKYAKSIPIELAKTKSMKVKQYTADGVAIGHWNSKTITTEYKSYTLPINKFISEYGTFKVTFKYASGASRLNIKSAELLVNGKPVSSDNHLGLTGNKDVKNVYILKLTEFAFGTKYAIRFTAKSDGGTDSNGVIYLKLTS